MDALVEVHDEREMERAAAVGATVVGINNRDLRSFAVDLSVSERLAPLAPDDAVVVAESGVFGPGDVKRLHEAGAHAVLVGEGLVTAPDRAAAVKALLQWLMITPNQERLSRLFARGECHQDLRLA